MNSFYNYCTSTKPKYYILSWSGGSDSCASFVEVVNRRPYEIFALYEGAREYIDDIKLSGFSADGYIIQKITIGSVEVV